MMKIITKKLTIILLTALLSFAAATPQQIHRFLLVAGANDGGHGRSTLRYAVTDARAFAAVLTEMGGVDERNKVFLSQPSVAEMQSGFSAIEQKLNDPRYRNGRKEIIVYYSGHADETGLLLGREIMQWSDLRSQVDALSADLKIAVVDACGSGAITRIKGGAFRPAFLSDASSDMKGYAFLTSSSADEVSQESDRIAGSFFTHALVSGLRGAADMTGSGTVTLSEAYQFAFNETLQSTQSTMGGAQHPSRDMNLTGTGDVVMTDLRHANSGLTLDADLEGRFFIRDDRGFLVAELYKARGRAIELGLPVGSYNIYVEAGWAAEGVRLDAGEKVLLTRDMLRSVRREQTVTRGDDGIIADNGIAANNDSACTDGVCLSVPDDAAEVSMLDSACRAPYRFNGNLFVTSDRPDNGMQLSFIGNVAQAEFCGTQVALGFNIANKDMSGAQISVGLNLAAGRFNGAQLSNLNVIGNGGSGAQGGMVNILNGNFQGVQGGMVNLASGNIDGIQGGMVNIARDIGYIQGGMVNIARDIGYVQGGMVNIARDVGYVQGGMVNIARDAGYVQGGMVNIAGKSKYQFGLVNIARYSEKTPVGLLNIIGNGVIDMTVYGDIAEDMPTFSLRTGTPWFYTVIEYSQPVGDFQGFNQWPKAHGFGVGTRFGMNGPLHANVDFVWLQFEDYWRSAFWAEEEEGWWYGYKLRVGGSYNPLPFVAFTAGVSINGRIEGDDRWSWPEHEKRFGSWHSRWTERGHRLHTWPGLYAGVTVGKVRASDKIK
ncbi:MAG: caspase family protein [Chitinispirillales bacterium]|jgi:hypothetical protein|nr:caspase family protein [Chitinispirillales bacterium]